MAGMHCFLRFTLLIVSLKGLDAFLTSSLTPSKFIWSVENKKSSNSWFRGLRPCRAAHQAFSIQAKDDIPTLKQNLLSLCEKSQRGLVPFDPPSKQQFEELVSAKKHSRINLLCDLSRESHTFPKLSYPDRGPRRPKSDSKCSVQPTDVRPVGNEVDD